MIAFAPRVGHPLARTNAATAGTARPGFELAQTEALLELARGALRARTVVVHAGPAAVLGNQPDDDVSMIRTAGGLSVADRHPAALSSRVGAGEAHRRDEFLTYLRPPFV